MIPLPKCISDCFRLTVFCFSFLLILSTNVRATEEYTEKTGEECATCHHDPSGGGELTETGEGFLLALLEDPGGKKEEKVLSFKDNIHHLIRFIAGFIHVITAILWFGTILYVHLILKPSYAIHGLPPKEVMVGLVSILIMAVTGSVLVLYRVPSFSFLITTRFGILLMVKTFLFCIMAGSAAYVVFHLGPKLKQKALSGALELKRDLTADELSYFDGKEGRPGYFAYKGKVYDIRQSKLWKEGMHFTRHRCGEDLTEMLDQAPHGEEKIMDMPRAGKLMVHERKADRQAHEQVFYFMAYMNLIVVFLITLILAMWRWW